MNPIESLLGIFTAFFEWMGEALTAVSGWFWVAETGFTFIGALTGITFAIAVVLLVFAVIRSLIRGRG